MSWYSLLGIGLAAWLAASVVIGIGLAALAGRARRRPARKPAGLAPVVSMDSFRAESPVRPIRLAR